MKDVPQLLDAAIKNAKSIDKILRCVRAELDLMILDLNMIKKELEERKDKTV